MKRFLLLLICTAGMMLTHAQKLYQTYLEYIDRYAASAIEEQKKYGIPASITLSQGLLESQAGQSELARNTNNHFGIKCHNDWTGGTYYYDDDARGECFRVYDRVEQSFDDHSKFLANRQRYADLFELDPTDYKAWAKGLKADGYATDPNYANKLIKLIEDYELHRFDTWSQTAAVQQGTARTSTSKSDTKTSKTSTTATKDSRKTTAQSSTTAAKRPVIRNNGIRCVEARSGDTYQSIATEMGYKTENLLSFNDVTSDRSLSSGELVYLGRKRTEANRKSPKIIIVKEGDTAYRIAQTYGIILQSLYDMNSMDYTEGVQFNQRLILRTK